jgi:hypothetical protein
MLSQTQISPSFVVVAALLALAVAAGCGGDDDEEEAKPVAGTFVGTTPGTREPGDGAFVAVVVSPATGDAETRDVKVYYCEGRGANEWFPGSVSGESFKISSDDGDAEVTGTLTERSATGSVELADCAPIREQPLSRHPRPRRRPSTQGNDHRKRRQGLPVQRTLVDAAGRIPMDRVAGRPDPGRLEADSWHWRLGLRRLALPILICAGHPPWTSANPDFPPPPAIMPPGIRGEPCLQLAHQIVNE